ncbi:hypothetical protein [Sulfurimonas sp. NWX367]|uniref:hypothetical protein n=1 Tax=unclassified Sulfurimonas TaxID=2623549 RepID=UPI003204E659
MNYKEIQKKIKQLEELKAQVLDAEVKVIGYQDNEKLLKLLSEEYPKIFSPVRNQILALVEGKKPLTKVDSATRKKLEYAIKGECFINEINPLDKTGALLPFKKLTAKISKEISLLSKKNIRADLLDFLES